MVIYSSKMVTQPSRIMLNLLENPWKILLHWSHIDHTPNFSDCFALKRPRFFRQSFKSWFLMVLACFHSYSFAKPCQSPENSWFSKVFHAQFQGLTDIDRNLPSGKQSQKTMENQKITMFYGRFSTISMAIFNSYVSLPEGKPPFSYGFPMVFLWIPYLPYGEIVGKPKGFDRWWQPPRFVQAQPAGAGRYTCSLRYSAGGSKGTPSRWIAAWRRISWWVHGD